MKKQIAWITVLVSAAALLNGCGTTVHRYSNGDQYTTGGAELTEEIDRIDIGWDCGDVEIQYHEQDTVSFSESANREQSDKETMRYWLDGDTLHIHYAKSGARIESGLEKKLTLYIPEHMTEGIFEIETVSADVIINSIAARSVEVDTVSGNFTGILKDRVYELTSDTTSGDIDVQLDTLDSFEMDSVSGNITISAKNEVKAGSVDSVSGDFTLRLPEDASFHAEVETTSGTVQNAFDGQTNGKSGVYISGSGSNEYEIDTVSGNIFLEYENE
ncbi:MAG: DUF4097 family beta strand repeat protein [Ruminococcus sp.]|nr:DUF4097 family beta strand repeat protein [Ruminococcus sp.]